MSRSEAVRKEWDRAVRLVRQMAETIDAGLPADTLEAIDAVDDLTASFDGLADRLDNLEVLLSEEDTERGI